MYATTIKLTHAMTNTDSSSPQDNASHGVEVQLRVRHWSVTVTVEGMDVVTIESNCLSGLENVTDFRPEIIEAAENLLAFIGTGEEAGFEFDDMQNAQGEAQPTAKKL